MVCDKTCKWMCIVSYIIAALGAIICSWNHLVESQKVEIPKGFSIVCLIGGVITLICAIRWTFRAETPNVLV